MIGPFDPYSGIDRRDYMNRLANLDPYRPGGIVRSGQEADFAKKSKYIAEMARRLNAEMATTTDNAGNELLLLIEDEAP